MHRTKSSLSLGAVSTVVALTLTLGLGAAPSRAASVPAIHAVGAPSAVTGTDGRRHLVYELGVDNGTRSRVRLERLEVIDPARENVVASTAAMRSRPSRSS